MSWKGFSKAVTRLPTRLAQRAGYASESIDQEYLELESQFKRLDGLARKFSEDAKKFKDSLSAMLAHQTRFADTLVTVYRPIQALAQPAKPGTPGGSGSLGAGATDGEDDEEYGGGGGGGGYSPGSGGGKSEYPQSLAAAESFAAGMKTAREQLRPDLDIIERQMVAPVGEYILLLNNVKRLMEKRARKLVDYDRHKDNVAKLSAKPDRNMSDDKRLNSLEASLDQATREFNNVDQVLKRDLPIFLGLRTSFIDPCFQTLYFYELKVVTVLHECFDGLCRSHFDMSVTAAQGFDSEYENMMQMLGELTLAKRTFRRGNSQDELNENPYDQAATGGGSKSSDRSAADGPSDVAAPPAYEEKQYKTAASVAAAFRAGAIASPAGGSASTQSTTPRATFVLALYDFDGAEEGDLVFKKDDKIEVVQRTEDANDWWQGKCKGVVGQFPGNYVCEL
ncbi:hypothetical protein HKX48_002240 [Thoreauomyces humboldtii]|nr:hypothetical protein HKX48_002240 [Thoreauomyces humboldtii]